MLCGSFARCIYFLDPRVYTSNSVGTEIVNFDFVQYCQTAGVTNAQTHMIVKEQKTIEDKMHEDKINLSFRLSLSFHFFLIDLIKPFVC